MTQTILPVASRMKGCPRLSLPSRNATQDSKILGITKPTFRSGPGGAISGATFQEVSVFTKHIKMIQGERIKSYNKRKIEWNLFWLIFQVNKVC